VFPPHALSRYAAYSVSGPEGPRHSPTVGSWGGAVSYERGTSLNREVVGLSRYAAYSVSGPEEREEPSPPSKRPVTGPGSFRVSVSLQGFGQVNSGFGVEGLGVPVSGSQFPVQAFGHSVQGFRFKSKSSE